MRRASPSESQDRGSCASNSGQSAYQRVHGVYARACSREHAGILFYVRCPFPVGQEDLTDSRRSEGYPRVNKTGDHGNVGKQSDLSICTKFASYMELRVINRNNFSGVAGI